MNLNVGQNMQQHFMNEFEIESGDPWSYPQHYSDQHSVNQEWSSHHDEQPQIYQTPGQYYQFGNNSDEDHWSNYENNSYYENQPNDSNMNVDHITGDWNLQPQEGQNGTGKMNIDNEFSYNETFIHTKMEENGVFLKDEYDLSIGETSDLGSSINTTMEEVNGDVKNDDGIQYESDIPFNQKCNENVSNITNGSNSTDNSLVDYNQDSIGLGLINPENFDIQINKKPIVNDSTDTKPSISSSRRNERSHSEWQTDETLPTGWKKRSHIKRNRLRNSCQKGYQYLSSDNQIFYSRKDIAAHMEKLKVYSKMDIKMVLSGRKNIRLYDWEADDKLPSGWKSAYTNEKNYNFLSPENKQFHSKKAAIKFMNKQNYSNEDMEKIQEYIRPNFRIKVVKCRVPRNYVTDWISDSTLPDGWKKRTYEKRKKKKRSRNLGYDYISSDNQMFKSRADIVAHMEKSSFYTKSDITKVLSGKKNFCRSKWEADNNLPKGWKFMFTNRQYKFQTPENKRFRSRAMAVDFMKKSQYYSTEDIHKVENYSRPNKKCKNIKKLNVHLNPRQYITGWIFDSTLPAGWKKRSFQVNDSNSVSGKITRYEFLSDDNKIFPSRSQIVSFMKNSDKYNDKDIENVLSGLFRRRINEAENSISDTGLPPGWRIIWSQHSKHGKKRKYTYFSPDNKRFLSRRAAVEEIRKTGVYSEKELHAMLAVWLVENGTVKHKSKANGGKFKTSGKSENFISDTGLPSGWKIKWIKHDKKGWARRYIYISPMNKRFGSRKAAVEEIRRTGVYTEKELHDMLAIWLVKNGTVKHKWKANRGKFKVLRKSGNFISDTGLPSGWKIKWVKHDKKGLTRRYIYISPMNTRFGSRKAAVEEIRRTGVYSESELQAMLSFKKSDFVKAKLNAVEQNFITDTGLPQGWKVKWFKHSKNSIKRYIYVSPLNQIFDSRKAAIEEIKTEELKNKIK